MKKIITSIYLILFTFLALPVKAQSDGDARLNIPEIIDPNQAANDAKWFVIVTIALVILLLLAFAYYFFSEKPKR
ncbi:MAG: hypothetical protein ABIE68_00250 [bacterium]